MSKVVELKKRDAFDLFLVVSSILRDESNDIEFKDVIKLQKSIDAIKVSADNFFTKHDEISELRDKLLKAAQSRINAYKEKAIEESREKGDAAEYKEKIDAFAAVEMDSLSLQVNEEITPSLNTLYETVGEEDTAVTLEDDQLKVLVDNFEKHAKSKYTSKSRMTIVYEALTKSA